MDAIGAAETAKGVDAERRLGKLFQAIWFTHNKLSERLLSSDGGFSFAGSIQEVIKFRE